MNDLIRRDDVKRMINGKHLCVLDERILINALGDIPSAEPKIGKWIEEYNGNGWNDYWDYTCSNCGKKYERADILYKANYCPNCGAKMRGE